MLAPEGVDPLVKGGCFCGAVGFSVYGPPVLSAYCHCTLCQRQMGKSLHVQRDPSLNIIDTTGCPFVHTIHVKEQDFVWAWDRMPMSNVDYYENPSKPYKRRFRCKQCGTPVASFNTRTSEFSMWGAVLERGPDDKILGWEHVKPTAHQFYGTRMLEVEDGLGKWEGYQDKSARL